MLANKELEPVERTELALVRERRKGGKLAKIRRLLTERVLLAAFLLEAFIGGLALCATVPPFGGLDEPWHWFRTLQVARGIAFAPRLGPNNWGGSVDLHDVNLAYWFAQHYEKAKPISKQEARSLSASLNAKPAENAVIGFPSTASFSPIAYLPAAVPLFTARHLHLKPLTQVAFGRVGQLCIYILLVAITLWIFPAGRLVMAALLTMPTLVHLASCFSSDPVNFGMISLLIASCLRLHSDRASILQGWRGPALFGLVVMTGTLKITYLPLSFMILLAPARCFSSRRLRLLFVGSALAACWTLALSWNLHYNFNPGLYWHQGGDPKAALAFVVKHPILTLNGVYQMVYWNGWFLWTDMDVRFGGHAVPFNYFSPWPLPALEAVGLLTVALLSGVKGGYPRIVLACWISMAAVTILTLAAFRLNYGPPEVSTIFGLQGRYFVPAALLGLLGLVYVTPPVRVAGLGPAALLLCTHAVSLAFGVDHYLTLWH